MGFRFTKASSEGITNTTFGGITPAYPFTVGGWFMPLTTADGCFIWNAVNSANTTLFWGLFMNAAATVVTLYSGSVNLLSVNALTNGQWYYLIGRFISATNRRMTLLEPDLHAIEEVQSTTSNTPGAFNNEAIGSLPASSALFSTGIVAEMWRTNTDIQPDGAALLVPTLLQLAYRGPYSISSISQNLVWYKSFRQSNVDVTDTIDDPCFALNGRMGWAASTTQPAPTTHPPLDSDYVYLNTLKQKLMAV